MYDLDDDVIFDCSLFQDEYPLLARAVARRCQDTSLMGCNNVQIPYAQAVAFAGGRGKTYTKMVFVSTAFDLSAEEAKRNFHIRKVTLFITEKSNFQAFYARLKLVEKFINENWDYINRVYYGLGLDDD